VKTLDCNGRRELVFPVARDLGAALDFSLIENLTSPNTAVVGRTISSLQNHWPRFHTASTQSSGSRSAPALTLLAIVIAERLGWVPFAAAGGRGIIVLENGAPADWPAPSLRPIFWPWQRRRAPAAGRPSHREIGHDRGRVRGKGVGSAAASCAPLPEAL
jgi:hypothetical protein